jgi:dGTPase
MMWYGMRQMSSLPYQSVRNLAPYACLLEGCRGRLYPEEESPTRTAFQRDRDRIVHSGAFRRAKHKTQVFVYHEGDYFRTRLTHSLEVAQIARSISRPLGLDEDLAEAVALAHDLGHTPFGHAGEDVLAEMMEGFGGFDHNAHALRIVTSLEQRYAEFDGLNLTWDTLEGLIKHNGPVANTQGPIAEYCKVHELEPETFASLEAQVAALSDDIAYNNHDIDDGLRAGLFEVEDLMDLPLVGSVFKDVSNKYPGLARGRLIHESVRRMISIMVNDALEETQRRIAASGVQTVDDIRGYRASIAAFSDEMAAQDRAVKAFLYDNMYRHYRVNRMTSKVKRVVRELFELFLSEPDVLPPDWRSKTDGPGGVATASVVSDYIAGMTDRFALEEYRSLIGHYSL